MKKNIYTIISIILVLTMLFAIPVSAAKKGDLDNDGIVSAADARLTLRMSVGLEELDMAADVDGDGKVSAADARLILRASVGLENLEEITQNDPLKDIHTEVITETENEIPYDPTVDNPYYNMVGKYDPNRAGLLYDAHGTISSYDKIKEGSYYFVYDENGHRERFKKPYSSDHEPENLDICDICGKKMQSFNGEHFGCYYGYCDTWFMDVNCPECGEFVPRNTCHTCKN